MSSVRMNAFYIFIFSVLLHVSLFASTAGHEINYCGAKMCGYTNAHTFCQFASGPSPYCTGYIPAPLSPAEQARLLARMNRRRGEAARGRLPGLPSAGNMLALRWVGELAREAQLWADQCRPPETPEENDACRDLYSISVGQCVASVVGEAPGLRVESMVDIWYMQSMYYKGNVTLYEPPVPGRHYYGDFAQMLWARTYMVGCGRSRFMVPVRGRLRTVERLVCNFGPQGPPPRRALWLPAAPAAACPERARPHAFLSSLCDYQPASSLPNDKDVSMTLEEQLLLDAVLAKENNGTQYHERSLDDIYLTYIAIVTIQDFTATTIRNSMQKRDVVLSNNVENNNEIESNQILSTVVETTAMNTKLLKKNLLKDKIVGRPKAYNMEELSDIGDQTEGNRETPDVLAKRKKDFYAEYNLDLAEENITAAIEHTSIIKEKETHDTTLEEQTHSITSLPVTQNEVRPDDDKTTRLIYKTTTVLSTEIHIASTLQYNDSLVNTDKTLEEYLSDPETVRQLQEALDRMEREANATRSPGKMRRDLRDLRDSQNNELEENGVTLLSDDESLQGEVENEPASPPSVEEERNKTVENETMLNKVFQYMPYLKQYEKNILSTRNSAIRVCPSAVISFIVLCV